MSDNKQVLHMASGRLEGLGDGIFSVAMTLLAIELGTPLIKTNSWSEFLDAFRHMGVEFICYMVSFIILGIMWFGHRMMFEYIGRTNRYFIFLGVLFYMIVCLVPFSTRFIAANREWPAIMIYGLNLSFCNLSLYAQWYYGINNPNLMHKELPDEVRKEAKILFLLSPVVYSIAIGISFFIPIVSLIIFAVTPILYLIPNKLDKYLP